MKRYTAELIPNGRLVKRFLAAFGAGVSPADLKAHVLTSGNFLWHIFSWGYVDCLEGEAARQAFQALDFKRAWLFRGGYSQKGFPRVWGLACIGKLNAVALDAMDDVYVLAGDFSWVYVHTHEEVLGPYFCYLKD
jgi:tRNA (guanine-N7-)-methyltransferase